MLFEDLAANTAVKNAVCAAQPAGMICEETMVGALMAAPSTSWIILGANDIDIHLL